VYSRQAFSALEISWELDAFLRLLEGERVMSGCVSISPSCAPSVSIQLADAIRPEETHEVVFEREGELRRARITLTARADRRSLAIDPSADSAAPTDECAVRPLLNGTSCCSTSFPVDGLSRWVDAGEVRANVLPGRPCSSRRDRVGWTASATISASLTWWYSRSARCECAAKREGKSRRV